MKLLRLSLTVGCLFGASMAWAEHRAVTYTTGACDCKATYDPALVPENQAKGLLSLNELLMGEWISSQVSCGVGKEILIHGLKIPPLDVPQKVAEANDSTRKAYEDRIRRLKALDLPPGAEKYRDRELVSLEISHDLEAATLNFLLSKDAKALRRPFRQVTLPESCNTFAHLAAGKNENKMWRQWEQSSQKACESEPADKRDTCLKNRENQRTRMSEDKNIACELLFHEWHGCANGYLREKYLSMDNMPDLGTELKKLFPDATCECHE